MTILPTLAEIYARNSLKCAVRLDEFVAETPLCPLKRAFMISATSCNTGLSCSINGVKLTFNVNHTAVAKSAKIIVL